MSFFLPSSAGKERLPVMFCFFQICLVCTLMVTSLFLCKYIVECKRACMADVYMDEAQMDRRIQGCGHI